MKRTIQLIISGIMSLTLFNSCTEAVPSYAPNGWHSVDPDEYFDFSTTVTVPVTVKFDSKTLVYIFDPNTYGNITTDGRMNMLFSAFTDDNGYYSADIEIPSACLGHDLLAIADGYRCKARVTTAGVVFEAHFSEEANSRAEDDEHALITHDKIVKWCKELDALYKKRFPEETNNYGKIEPKNDLCLNIIKNDTELTFSFVHSGGRYMSAVYYYYYPEEMDIRAEFDDSVDKLYDFLKSQGDKFLLTKNWNCVYTGTQTYSGTNGNGWISPDETCPTQNKDVWKEFPAGYVNRNFNNKVGASNPILFYGRYFDQEPKTLFPAGYRMGFLLDVIETDGQGNKTCNNEKTKVTEENERDCHHLLFTHKMFNKGQYQQSGRALKALNVDTEGKIIDSGIVNLVYGFEDKVFDKSDKDFNDMMFMITATPKVSTANIPVVGVGAAINGGTLMFEDLYPDAGDYDMNDVIVEYEFVKKFGDDNILTSVDYQFWPLHYGATYHDDFYFTIEPTANTNHFNVEPILVFNHNELQEGARQNEAVVPQMEHLPYYKTGSLDVADKKIPSNSFNTDIFNPFIYVHNSERQVHLVNKPFVYGVGNSTQAGITDEGTLKYHPLLNNHDGAYYPFAMNIPLRYSDDSHTRFRPVKESARIESEYYKFLDWMVSGGAEYKEWYFYYNGDLEW